MVNELQQTKEWFDARRGKFSASDFGVFMKDGKDQVFLKGAITILYQKIAERLTGETDEIIAEAIEWGNENEEHAIKRYEEVTGKTVKAVGFIPLQGFEDWAGGSPDGMIDNDEGLIEVKCPFNSKNHVHTLIEKDIPKASKVKYFTQMQFNMMVTGTKYCDFVSYDPRLPDKQKQICIIRFERDEEYIEKIKERLKLAIDELKRLENAI